MKKRSDPEESSRTLVIDPKRNWVALPWLVAIAAILGVWRASNYWTKFETTVETHTSQITKLDEKVDQLIKTQNDRFRWQSATLRSISNKVGAAAVPEPTEVVNRSN